ncbi:hypothetical protein C7H83_03675 [Tetragenococcus halophilus]|uniref:Uncharacterized protein n=1 Tax=Tetragenococcus halophilus TaxID=51669 RepID=A0A3G5FH30_TETHA|nr:hypothetical protein C7H83_03675 [Tetragenococcus halophilus]
MGFFFRNETHSWLYWKAIFNNKSVILGAIINIIANLALLPTIGFWGVVVSMLAAEFFVTFVRVRSFTKNIEFKFDYVESLFIQFRVSLCV